MKHEFKQKVFYSDTDAYGVVWHGSYLRWLEMGRIGLCEDCGHKLSQLEKEDIALPVAEINIKYKSPARLEDEMIIETEVKEYSRISMTFKQVIKNAETGTVNVEAFVKVVAVHNSGELYRKLPDTILKFCSEAE